MAVCPKLPLRLLHHSFAAVHLQVAVQKVSLIVNSSDNKEEFKRRKTRQTENKKLNCHHDAKQPANNSAISVGYIHDYSSPHFPSGEQNTTPTKKGHMQQGERKMTVYRQSPSFWPHALLSQHITLSLRRVSPFSRRVIFTCSCISLTLLSLRENGDYSKSYYMQVEIASLEREETGLSKLWQRFLTLFNTRDRE